MPAFSLSGLLVLLLGSLQGPAPAPPQSGELEGDYLYKVVMLRAAPGRLVELLFTMDEERDLFRDAGEPGPFWMRHTQGDQWDLLIFYPMGSFYEYYEPGRVARRLASGTLKGLAEEDLLREASRMTARRDELFVRGPQPSVLEEGFGNNGFYHVEMMVALAGRQEQLLEERRMENVYRKELGRPQNLIFVREAGGPWDNFTLGFYRNLSHFAETDAIPAAEADRAARAAGFDNAAAIGPYMRSLIDYHRDTQAVAIR